MSQVTPQIANQRYKEKLAEIEKKQIEENQKLALKIKQTASKVVPLVLEDIDKLTKETCSYQYVIRDNYPSIGENYDVIEVANQLKQLGWNVNIDEEYDEVIVTVTW